MRLMAIVDASVRMPGLEELTMYRTAASIPFGGRYRLIDFTLSNVVNSGINSVGIFPTNPFVSLLDHVGMGKSWDLDRRKDGLFLLPPTHKNGGHLTVGAFAPLEEHRSFFLKSRQEHIVITNSFTVSQIKYHKMLDAHIKSGADITEAVSGDRSLKSYIISRKLLLELLDVYKEKRIISVEDLVNLKKKPYTYGRFEYEGYLAVIDSVQSYFNESLALLDVSRWNDLFLHECPIYTKVKDEPPTRYLKGSLVKRALLANGGTIEGTVTESIIGRAVEIRKNAKVDHCIIMQKCVIGEGCDLSYVIADKDVHIEPGVILHGTKENPVVLRKGERVLKEDVG
ncbi:sugar phosphate nucleotidyltransferase [Planococcus sp. N028]|uniref:Sugar phosphate nucleotidyltransferase n=1 Tax=Planococcus shixiaomingii TaxID=3058393 RepID=A0ABT8N689_9BACL|nr:MULTISPECIES: sugar phosphate nucleotidyltransferase [unclassified Planococcus (in: firmicutes)]MDN7243172.1 sugar phosphate nucleotidyltransferase [Planococcus sp. N028]WKA55116.1 sugar phosphate nucleotidyltransferase [Planococcus sp. N022]